MNDKKLYTKDSIESLSPLVIIFQYFNYNIHILLERNNNYE